MEHAPLPVHIDPNDPEIAEAASEILRRHDADELEANITTAVRDFLVRTRLVNSNEIREEDAPALGSRSAVDLTALDTFVEVKRRIGTAAGFQPDPENVRQLDDYLEQSQKQGRVRMGILNRRQVLAAPLARRRAGHNGPAVRLHPRAP